MNKTGIVAAIAIACFIALGCESTPDDRADEPPEVDEQAAEEAQEDDADEEADDQADPGADEPKGADEEATEEPEDDEAAAEADEQALEGDDWLDEEDVEALFPDPEADAGYEGYAGATPWEEADVDVPKRLADPDTGEGAEDPESLLEEVSSGWRGDDTEMEVLRRDEERALGVVMDWDWKDDSVYGADLRVEMRMRDGAWYVERLERRVHCRRGVSEERGLCI